MMEKISVRMRVVKVRGLRVMSSGPARAMVASFVSALAMKFGSRSFSHSSSRLESTWRIIVRRKSSISLMASFFAAVGTVWSSTLKTFMR